MDKYIVKEPRTGAGFPQANHNMMAFPANARIGNMAPPENYYSGNFNNVQQTVMNIPHNTSQMGHAQLMNPPHAGLNQTQINLPLAQTQTYSNMVPHSPMSGIDPRYLSGYGDGSPQHILAGQQIQRNQPPISSFGSDYQNSSFGGVDRNKTKNIPQTMVLQPHVMTLGGLEPSRVEEMPKPFINTVEVKNNNNQQKFTHKFQLNKPNELDLIRNDVQNKMMSRTDKLKALHKSGPRAFSGPVEKVLKWHKGLQDIGILIIYEIVAKCVSVRAGENCAKNLVVRDDSGPAMQVVYYEIDFLLPELKPPCTVRVVGRMMAGTCRLQAFNVRVATGDDVATLPRRAAVAAHHVAKLCKEYGHGQP